MKNKILNILAILVGLLILNGGLVKFFHYIPVPDNLPAEVVKDNLAFMEISWLMPLIGAAEIIGSILLIIPRTRALGVLVVFPVMIGVLLTHLLVDQSGLPVALVIWAILLWIIYENREKYYPLIR